MNRSTKPPVASAVASPPASLPTSNPRPPVVLQPGTETPLSRKKREGVHAAEDKGVELDGRRRYFELRHTWSAWIITWISVLILFNATLTALVGLGLLDFEKYQWFITAVTIETFLQIVGMGYIAVRFLFSK